MSSTVDFVCRSAQDAFDGAPLAGPPWTSDLLVGIADELESNRDRIVDVADQESRLGGQRLHGELSRTAGQLRAFATWAAHEYARVEVHDPPDATATPGPSPDLRRVNIPIGPVAVFAASNFPLAFGVAGGDAASALAAGNPVIARAHPLQIGTARAIGAVVSRALDVVGAPSAWFQLIADPGRIAGEELVRHPAIRAVGFTGSHSGGMALATIASRRSTPIPVYAEMGSINPLFITQRALEQKLETMASDLASSITLGVGQFCTKPGLIVIGNEELGARFVEVLAERLDNVEPKPMLSHSMTEAFHHGFDARASTEGVSAVLRPILDDHGNTGPGLLDMRSDQLLPGHICLDELFGPAAVIVRTERFEDVTGLLPGSLTATIHTADDEATEWKRLVRSLGRTAGRVIHNGYPTGVAVKPAMQHGGPYPSSNHDWATSVGVSAAQRFRRPVTFQSWPTDVTEDLRAAGLGGSGASG